MSIDWTTFSFDQWEPKDRATLCFIIRDGQVLLIEKKRGLGAGKVNGPGGRIESGETLAQCAVRETQEEVGVTPLNVEVCGELSFQFADEYSLYCTVYRADGFEGELAETDEAVPFWCELDKVPFDRMWQDDIYWFQHMIEGRYFKGYLTFDDDKMLSHDIQVSEPVVD